MSEEWHGKLDLRTRIRINERVGYRSKHVSMAELFNKLGKDYNNRQDYGQIMGIIQIGSCTPIRSEDTQRTRLRRVKQNGGMRVVDQYLHFKYYFNSCYKLLQFKCRI